MNLFSKSFLVIGIVFGVFFASASFVLGATSFTIEETPLSSGEILLNIKLEATKEVNAFQIALAYRADGLQSMILDDSGSEVDVWVRRDSRDNEELLLEGGFLRSVFGSVEIIALRVKPRGIQSPSFSISGSVYLSDGKGTREDISDVITYRKEPGVVFSEDSDPSDKEGPRIHNVFVAKNPFEDIHLLTFKIQDEVSGVAKSEVRFRKGVGWKEWETAYAPIRVPWGTWSFQISSFDNSGNRSLYTGYVSSVLFGKLLKIFLCFILVGVLLTIVLKIIIKKR